MRYFNSRWWLALPVVLFSFGVYANYTTNKAWDEMIATGELLDRGLEEANWTRSVLYGNAVEGLAWDGYQRAQELLSEGAYDDWVDCRRAAIERNPGSAELRDTLVSKNRAMLEALALAAHRTDARPPLNWSAGYNVFVPSLLESRTAVNIAVMAAEQQLDLGHPQRAAELLLNAMQFGRDIMHGPTHISTMVGCALVAITTKEALVDDNLCEHMLDRFPPEQLQLLARGLETLEEGVDLGAIAVDGELAFFIHVADGFDRGQLKHESHAAVFTEFTKFGHPGRTLATDFMRDTMSHREFFVGASLMPWDDLEEEASVIRMEQSSRNPVTRKLSIILPSVMITRRSTTALIRLARTAVEYRLTGKDKGLDDPFGGEFEWSEVEGRLRVRSVGATPGTNQGYCAMNLAL